MLVNRIHNVNSSEIKIPVLIRKKSNYNAWIPGIEEWSTKASGREILIDCPYETTVKRKSRNNETVFIEESLQKEITEMLQKTKWQKIIDEDVYEKINQNLDGRLSTTFWDARYVGYARTDRKAKWLHYHIFGDECPQGYVIHHIDEQSFNVRKKNLQILRKNLHDSINHSQDSDLKKLKFWDTKEFFQKENIILIEEISREYYNKLLLNPKEQKNVVDEILKLFNPDLAKRILQRLQSWIKVFRVESIILYNQHEAIFMNRHLDQVYLDNFELTILYKLCKKQIPKQEVLYITDKNGQKSKSSVIKKKILIPSKEAIVEQITLF